MSREIDSTNELIQRSRRVADNADYVSLALANNEKDQAEDAFDDLLAAYDSYANRAASHSSRYSFDEVANLESLEARDQGTADALASVLIDFEVALVLAQAAQAVGEIEGEAGAADLDESVSLLTETLQAIEGTLGVDPDKTQFAFDEVAEAEAEGTKFSASPDLATAKNVYEQQVKKVYDRLLAETTALLSVAFKEGADLDPDKIKAGFEAVEDVVNITKITSAGRAIPKIVDAIQRAIKTTKDIIGTVGLEKIEAYVNDLIEEIKNGEGALQIFLKHSYQYDAGQQKISAWVKGSQSDTQKIDTGTQQLVTLHQQVVQTFTLAQKIVTNVQSLRGPIEWIIKKVGGTAPLDLLLAGIFLLVADVALLRGMDYADTTSLVQFVEGTVIISERTLAPGVAE